VLDMSRLPLATRRALRRLELRLQRRSDVGRVTARIGPMTITKSEAARRQLDAAIRLYFEEGDEVAVHTLVGAAHILIADLSKAAKLESILDRYIVPEYRGKFEGAIRSAQNFFKHSDRDGPDATLEFDPHFTELMLVIDIEMFKELTGSATDAMRVFLAYASGTWAKNMVQGVPEDVLAEAVATAEGLSKREFYAFMMELTARGRAAGTIE
jgi:hypothetical protein